ncbi:MAG: GFA family protein [Pirellulales bacterium]|nr:GFA family protein [Pirellulales bacterium]
MCQRWIGVAAAMGVFFDVESFRFTKGGPAKFMTSKILERHFCANCGGSIGHRYKFGDTSNIEIIFVGTLDDPSKVPTPNFYFGVEDHIPDWITLVDGIPQIRADTSPQIAESFAEADAQQTGQQDGDA